MGQTCLHLHLRCSYFPTRSFQVMPTLLRSRKFLKSPCQHSQMPVSSTCLSLWPGSCSPSSHTDSKHSHQSSAWYRPSKAFLSTAFITEGYLRWMKNSLNNLMQPVGMSQSSWFGSHVVPYRWRVQKTYAGRKDHMPKGQWQFDTTALRSPKRYHLKPGASCSVKGGAQKSLTHMLVARIS